MKKTLFFTFLLLLAFTIFIVLFYNKNNILIPNINNTAKRTSIKLPNTENKADQNVDKPEIIGNETVENIAKPDFLNEAPFSNNIKNENIPNNSQVNEFEISSFSTEILTSDPNRNNNIRITCNTLNNHIVEPGETFSFTELIGKSTYEKGYEKANIIEADGDTIKGLGGGNCQVSSTLYNAVNQVPELEVIERHNHASEVYYVPIGQDAAVAYGSVDFKFKNNSNNKIKIYASTNDKTITTKLFKLF